MFATNAPFVHVMQTGGSPVPGLEALFGHPFFGAAMPPSALRTEEPLPQGFDAPFAPPFGWLGFPDPAFFEAAFQTQGDSEPKQPPTAAAELQAMPVLKVCEEDLDAESNECTICLEKLNAGESALRIPCGHLFHEDCVRTWLQSNNQCPMCRYELPTEDASLEQGRRERMADRKPRITLKMLSSRCVRELKYLARHLGVSAAGCIEKQELVSAIADSGKIDIIPGVAEDDRQEESLQDVQNSSLSTLHGDDAKADCSPSNRNFVSEALLAITDGEPIIPSFLGDHRPLAALSKRASSVLTGPLARPVQDVAYDVSAH